MQNITANQTNKTRLYALDGLRGVFAFGVMLYHYCVWSEVSLPSFWDGLLSKFGIFGVAGFFVISGYSMHYAYFSRMTSWASLKYYFIRRFFRIAPLFWGICLCYLGLKTVFTVTNDTEMLKLISEFVLNISFIFGFIGAGEHSIAVGGWSIGVEWVFYCIFPFLIHITRKHAAFLWAALLLSLTYYLYSVNIRMDYTADPSEIFFQYARPDVLLVYFVAGCAAAHFFVPAQSKIFEKWAKGGMLFVIGLFVAMPLLGEGMAMIHGWSGFAMTALAIIMAIISAKIHFSSRVLQKGAEFMGSISYALYLSHFLVFNVLSYLNFPSQIHIAASVAATVIGSYIVYRFYEMPILRWSKRFQPARSST